MRRAVRESDKEARRAALRAVAWRLFHERPYEAINVGDVAEQAGLAKGTVYLYFATKEELFLSVQEQQFDAWFDTLDGALRQIAPGASIPEIAATITATLVAAPAMVRLFAIAHAVLERNVGADPIMRLKTLLRDRLVQSGALLEQALPALTPGDGPRVLLHAYALILGIQSLADPSPVVRDVIAANPELAVFQIDFAQELSSALTALLRGQQA
ncbi:MAG: helix-turn-helix transcriptional regulator [Chloroflexales bacterium]|nr:helix-turn-helix transcriptional regulator [Chloroflexales bacterium]